MSRAVAIIVGLAIITACSVAPTATVAPELTTPKSPAVTLVAAGPATLVPMATSSPTATASPSATPTATTDPTQSADATIEAIALSVTASGVPEGSSDFYAQVDATRCAILPPPTATPLPWALVPEGDTLYSANCLGSDLPELEPTIWLDGQWVEAANYRFVEAADLAAVQTAYEGYLSLISFQNAPPSADFEAGLAEAMWPADVLPSPQSCLLSDVLRGVRALQAQGQYVRLTLASGVVWDKNYYLAPTANPPQATLYWRIPSVQQTLIQAETGEAVRAAQLSAIAGTVTLVYDATAAQWRVADDASGYYCDEFNSFTR